MDRPSMGVTWWVVTGPVLLVGAAVAPFVVDAAVLWSLGAAGLVVAGVGSGCLRLVEEDRPRRDRQLQVLRHAATGSLGAVAACGWLWLFGAGALLLAVPLVGLAPRFRSGLERRLRLRRAPRPLDPRPGVPHEVLDGSRTPLLVLATEERVAALDDDAIAALWRRSGLALVGARAGTRARLVRLRELCLDELDRRDHEGLDAWLAASPHPMGDPTRFFARRDPPGVAS